MKKIVCIAIALVAIIAAAAVLSSYHKSDRIIVYHITLADPKLYIGEIFTDNFKIQKGSYQFSFVPSGDSPQLLSIQLKGSTFSLSRDFQLQGTLHNTGISTYYTWNYVGETEIQVPNDSQLEIIINPNGGLVESISVDIVKI